MRYRKALRQAWQCLGLFFLLLTMLPAAAGGGEPFLFQAPQAGWLRDAGGRLGIAEVAADGTAFQPFDGSLGEGHTDAAYWLRLTLPDGMAGEQWLDVPLPVLDDVRLYQRAAADGAWLERRGGNALPFDAREGPYRNASFSLGQPQAGEVLYLRIRSSSALTAIPRLWRAAALRAENERQTLAAGAYLGIMAGMTLFSLAGWLTTRRGLYGVFALFVACSALRWAALDGLLGEYLFASDARLSLLVGNALLGAQALTGSWCQIRLLQLRQGFPWLLRYYRWCGMVLGALAMALPQPEYSGSIEWLLFLLLLPAPLLSIPAYARLWRGGRLSERLMAVALPLHFCVMLPAILGVMGWLPFLPGWAYLARWAGLPVLLTLHVGIVLQMRDAERARDDAERQVAAALQASRQERAARQEQQRFLEMMAHEVRTPMAVIDAAAHNLRLLDQVGGEPALRESRYRSIQQAVTRMRTLMELIEAQEWLSDGNVPPGDERLDLERVTRELLASLDLASAARVVLTAEAGLAPFRGDARLMYFALLNLLDNALKYADPGTPVCIDIGTDAAGRGLSWRIRDHGPGIPAGKEDMIFDKYRRLDEAGTKPGLGLGLALARRIIERQAGHVRVDRAWRDGACFAVWLPAA